MIGNVVIFGVDPGVQTGVAAGIFAADSFGLPSIADVVSEGRVETWTTPPRRGSEQEFKTVDEIMKALWIRVALCGGPGSDVGAGEDWAAELWIEDFVLTRLGSSDRDGLAPVRVTAVLEHVAFEHDVKVEKVLPAASKKIVSDVRLKEWGGWIKGRDHERDAFRQLIMGIRQHRAEYLRKPA